MKPPTKKHSKKTPRRRDIPYLLIRGSNIIHKVAGARGTPLLRVLENNCKTIVIDSKESAPPRPPKTKTTDACVTSLGQSQPVLSTQQALSQRRADRRS